MPPNTSQPQADLDPDAPWRLTPGARRTRAQERAHGQSLLAALNRAAQLVLRARTPHDVYRVVGEGIVGLGYHAIVFTLAEDRSHLALSHLTLEPTRLQAVKDAAARWGWGDRFAVVPGGIHDTILSSEQPLFFENLVEPLVEGLPGTAHGLAARIAAMLGLEQAIYAPLRVDGEPQGLLVVSGTGLTKMDVPAVAAFASQAAIALENARLYQEVQEQKKEILRQAARAEALARTAARLNAQLDLSAVLNAVCEEAARGLGVPASTAYLYDELSQELAYAAGCGLPAECAGRWPSMARAAYDAFYHREGPLIVIPDVQATPDLLGASLLSDLDVRTFASAAMLRQEHLVGTLNVHTLGQVRHFSEEELAFLQGLADQAAVAIANARLFDESMRRAARQEALNAIIAAAAVTTELPALLETALDHALRALQVEGGAIWVEEQQIVCGLSAEVAAASIRVAQAAVQGSVEQAAVRDCGEWMSGEEVPHLDAEDVEPGIRAWLAAPIVAEEKCIGGLILVAPVPRLWSAEEVSLAEAVGQQLGGAAQRFRLLDEACEQALRVRQVLGTVPEGVLLLDVDLRILLMNAAARRHLRVLADAQWGEPLACLGRCPISALLAPPPQPGLWHEIEVEGTPCRVFEVNARSMGGRGQVNGWVLVLRDVSEQRRIEHEMHRQERMASIGQLAGGVAHDFNNLLTAIHGYAELLLSGLTSGDPLDWPSDQEMCEDLKEVIKAAERAASLTRQLLAFSRKQVLRPQVLDLNTVVAGMHNMLCRLIGEDIELVTALSPDLEQVEADPGQIEQVIMNLVVNARDAMPRGGRLVLETANVVLDEASVYAHPEARPGNYAMLAVSDTGVGMSIEALEHLFEPFFTTKERGRGTGLGLATVYGIVKQSGGNVQVRSAPQAGTTFKVYLPSIGKANHARGTDHLFAAFPRGTETILIAEDEEGVRELASRVLQRLGYAVLKACRPSEALLLGEQHKGPIDLLVSDVLMPEMSGQELVRRMVPARREMRVLYISGYTDRTLVEQGILEPGTDLLLKPFTPAALANKVRKVLDAAPAV